MAKIATFPIRVRVQSVEVKIYREKAKTTKSGYTYCVAWIGPDGRNRKSAADLPKAKEFAEMKAAQLAAGLSEAKHLNRSDVFELHEARAIAGDISILTALKEWKKAQDFTGGNILEACARWSEQKTGSIDRIKVPAVVEKFIAAKNALGKQGTRTYEAKLKPLIEYFPDIHLDTITAQQWTKYLNQFEDGVTRNDLRKRAVTLCRWAQRNNYLSDTAKLEVEKTERAKEIANPIGILEPQEYLKVLQFFRKKHPEYLAAVVLAGFCGLRVDEIQGKRRNRELRQKWEDIHLDQKFLAVTAAKDNTPSSRMVALMPVTLAWLNICTDQSGPVCVPGGMEKARKEAKDSGFKLPENCFRHSWITYQIALTGNKPATATEAGNSVKEIDRRYRVPKPKKAGEDWFNLWPDA